MEDIGSVGGVVVGVGLIVRLHQLRERGREEEGGRERG